MCSQNIHKMFVSLLNVNSNSMKDSGAEKKLFESKFWTEHQSHGVGAFLLTFLTPWHTYIRFNLKYLIIIRQAQFLI